MQVWVIRRDSLHIIPRGNSDIFSPAGTSYAEWEKETEPKVSTFMRLAEILELNPIEIFKDYNLEVNKAGIVTSKIDSIQASLEELKKMFVPEISSSAPKKAPQGGKKGQVMNSKTFRHSGLGGKSKGHQRRSGPDSAPSEGNNNKE
jgi:hypothetical protein